MEKKIYDILCKLHQWGVSNTEWHLCDNAKKDMFCGNIEGLREQPCIYLIRSGNEGRMEWTKIDWESADQICVLEDKPYKYYIWYFTLNNNNN